jgi:hypothetical protein
VHREATRRTSADVVAIPVEPNVKHRPALLRIGRITATGGKAGWHPDSDRPRWIKSRGQITITVVGNQATHELIARAATIITDARE